MLGREIDRHFAEIQSWIQGTGSWGLLVYVGLFVLATSLLVPDSVLCVLGGVLFDLKSAIAATIIAMFVSSVLQFALSHRLLRPRIQRMLTRRPALEELHGAILHDELYLQVLLRLTPLNPATLTYVLGAIGVRFSRFLIACAALIPALVIEVYIGHASRHIARLATGDVPSARLHDVLVIVGLVMCVVAFVAVSRVARKAIARAVARAEAAEEDRGTDR
jgi:uncharacterized membrane protein YdjX (TVP38/TMEM64 family)